MKGRLAKKNTSTMQIVIFVLCINSVCMADVVEFTDEVTFRSACGNPEYFIDFETYGDGSPVIDEPLIDGNEWLNLGIQFAEMEIGYSLILSEKPGMGVSPTHALVTAGLSPGHDRSSRLITFSTPVISFGVYIVDNETTSSTERIILKDVSGNVLGDFPMPVGPSCSQDFRGYLSDIAIAEVRIIEANDGESALLDNAMYSVPEPPCGADEMVTYTFQQSADGYTGTEDTFVSAVYPDNPIPEYPLEIMVDGGGLDEHGLLRFHDVFGDGPGQITIGSTILSATLTLHQTVPGGNVEVYVHRMLLPWDDDDTWNQWGNGIQADGIEAVGEYDAAIPECEQDPILHIDVTASVQAWSNGDDNYGWALLPGMNSPAGRRFSASEWPVISMRLMLEVLVCEPHPPCPGCTLAPWQLHAPESDMVIPVHGFGAAALDGYLYAVGGQSSTSSYGTTHVQKYDPQTDGWIQVASLQQQRHSLDCAVVDGYIYAIAGHVYNSMSTNERYDPSTNTWTFMAPKPTAVSGLGIAVFNGKIYTFGGNRYGSLQSVIEVYDPATNSWQNAGNMPAPGEPWRAATLGSRIYLAGGNLGGFYDRLWSYDPATGIWDTDLPRLNFPRTAHELVVVGDCLFAIGGSAGPLSSVESWKPGETAWTLVESLNVARGYLGAEAFGDTIFAFGGIGQGLTLSSTESAACEPPAIEVEIDIKPASCPNPLNVNSKGVLPVAILGTEDLDVNTINLATVQLAGVDPCRSDYADVATPFEGDLCDCTEEGPDGYLDLILKFRTQQIVAAVGDVNDGDVVELILTGALSEQFCGTPIVGSDCVHIIKKKSPGPRGPLDRSGRNPKPDGGGIPK